MRMRSVAWSTCSGPSSSPTTAADATLRFGSDQSQQISAIRMGFRFCRAHANFSAASPASMLRDTPESCGLTVRVHKFTAVLAHTVG